MSYTSESVEYHGIPYTKFGGHVFSGAMDSEVNGRKPPFNRVQWGQQAEEFQAREDDIWISAYAKSGHHWAHQYLSMILNDAAEFVPGVKESSFFEMHLPKQFDDMESPRLIFTHINTRLMPKDVFKKKSKILFLSRNPKDVAVSLYYHCFDMIYALLGKNDRPSFSDFLDDFLDGKVEGGSWFEYTNAWWKLAMENSNILVVAYEDLKQDTSGKLKEIADFLGRPIDDARSKQIAEAVNFKSLKAYMSKQIYETDIVKAPGYMKAMYRKGTVGDWKNHFTVADNEKFDKLFSTYMENCDLKVQFELS